MGGRVRLGSVRRGRSGEAPKRDAPRESNEVREQWMANAIADEHGLVLDSIELDRDGPSYTADTLAVLRERFPDSPLVCILGQDAFDGLVTWFRWEDIGELAHVVVVPRPGTPSSPVESLPGLMRTDRIEDLQQSLHGRLLAANVTPLAVSSTQVRRLLVQGRSVRYLVPDAVWHALAQTSEQSPPVYDA